MRLNVEVGPQQVDVGIGVDDILGLLGPRLPHLQDKNTHIEICTRYPMRVYLSAFNGLGMKDSMFKHFDVLHSYYMYHVMKTHGMEQTLGT